MICKIIMDDNDNGTCRISIVSEPTGVNDSKELSAAYHYLINTAKTIDQLVSENALAQALAERATTTTFFSGHQTLQ